MTLDTFMHGLGIASLFAFSGAGVLSIGTIVTMLRRDWPRITAALRGEITFPVAHPQPFRPRARPVAQVIPESTKMRDAA